MKRHLITALIVIAAATFVLSQMRGNKAAQSGNAEQEVRALVQGWDESQERRDTGTLNRILADDFSYTDASGTVLTRAEYLMSVVKAPDMSQQTYVSDDLNVRVYGDTAVVTGRSTWKGRTRGMGQFLSGQYRFTDVWVNRLGRWQVVATQATSIAH